MGQSPFMDLINGRLGADTSVEYCSLNLEPSISEARPAVPCFPGCACMRCKAVDAAPEILVTPEMIAAGTEAFYSGDRDPRSGSWDADAAAIDAYRAMAALAPTRAGETTAEGYERLVLQPARIAELIEQRDAALTQARMAGNRCYNAEGRFAGLEADLAAARSKIIELHRELHDSYCPVPVYLQHGDIDFALGCVSPDVAAQLSRGIPQALKQNHAMLEQHMRDSATNERLRDEISALTAEKAALHDALAPFLAQTETVAQPLVHNLFREFAGDRRRVGG
jgi:hypothetical protein